MKKMKIAVCATILTLSFITYGAEGDILTRTNGRRVIENGTAVTLTIGDTVIPATLNNDSVAARDLISRLPYTIPLYKYPDDYCAVMQEPLQYDNSERHRGWLAGDIDFVLPARWFVLLFNQNGLETTSTWHINLGTIDGDISKLEDLPNRIEVKIELAE